MADSAQPALRITDRELDQHGEECKRDGHRSPRRRGREPLLHGGDLGAARRLFPGAPEPFIDLSTGINPNPYPDAAPAGGYLRPVAGS